MPRRAVVLISGGLDSLLAARLIQELGIEVIPVYFRIPFCHSVKRESSCPVSSLVGVNLGLELRIEDISGEFLELVQNPAHGFGSNMNPCIDCKILMLKKVKGLLGQWGADFAVTGEVLGQRPMSQHRKALEAIEKKSGLEGLVLRPLSAKLLDPTIPEQAGWVNRQKLLDFSGRTRRPQIDLADKFGLKGYPNAAGGCLLTDPIFSLRLKDLIAHRELTLENIALLKAGRYFRLNDAAKLVVGRNAGENALIERLALAGDHLFSPREDVAGPTALGRGKFDEALVELSCRIVLRYCDLNEGSRADIMYKQLPASRSRAVRVAPAEDDFLKKMRV